MTVTYFLDTVAVDFHIPFKLQGLLLHVTGDYCMTDSVLH